MCKICFGGVIDPSLHKHTPVLLSVFLLYCHIFSMTDWKRIGTHVHMESHKSQAGYRITHAAYMESKSWLGRYYIVLFGQTPDYLYVYSYVMQIKWYMPYS